MFTVTEDYTISEDEEQAFFQTIQHSPEQIAKETAEEARRNEWEAYTLRMIAMEEMEEGDEADNFLLN